MATHPNLEDLAQTICTRDWIQKNYPEAFVVEIPPRDFYFDKEKMLSVMKSAVLQTDLIVFQSGYTMTGVHEYEAMRRIILESFPNNRIVILPQTIFYQTAEATKWAVETYKDRKNLLLLARDRISYEKAQSLFGYTQMAMFPDIVTTLIGKKAFNSLREGILFCVRDDWERLYTKKEMKTLIHHIKQYMPVSQTDTTVRIANTEDWENTRALIEQTIEGYSKFKLIVTDRYHGTIFALIAGTPVIILKTTDHKVVTGVEWFEPCMPDYISVADTLEQAEKLIFQMLEQPREYTGGDYFQRNYYDHLKTMIEEDSYNAECKIGGGNPQHCSYNFCPHSKKLWSLPSSICHAKVA